MPDATWFCALPRFLLDIMGWAGLNNVFKIASGPIRTARKAEQIFLPVVRKGLKASLILFSSAWLVACHNDSKNVHDVEPIARLPEVVADTNHVSGALADFPVVVSEYVRTDYTMRIIKLAPGAMRYVQPDRGTNYVIERVREIR